MKLILSSGMPLMRLAYHLQCHPNVTASAHYCSETTANDFREAVKSPHQAVVVNYDMKTLGRSRNTIGHHSPVAGYHEECDAVLVLDVAWEPMWVGVEPLWRAMNTSAGTKTRGFCVVKMTTTAEQD